MYALLRERMADEYDIPTTDEVIDAVLEIARAFHVAALRQAERDALAGAVQRVEALPCWGSAEQGMWERCIAAIKGTDDGE